MRRIADWNEVKELVSLFRNRGLVVTNFYPNEKEMSEWIGTGSFFVVEAEQESGCFLHRTDDADFLFFFLKGLENLGLVLAALRKAVPDTVLAYDYICRTDEEAAELQKQNADAAFACHTLLRRMNVINPVIAGVQNSVSYAEASDADVVHKMFCSSFDPISERIPTKKQLESYIQNKQVLVKRIDGELAGFAVIDIQKRTMYLKHLLTSPRFRRQGLAEGLLNDAFCLSKDCSRFILWVIDGNQPAIRLYEKFGYKFECLRNYTYVCKP